MWLEGRHFWCFFDALQWYFLKSFLSKVQDKEISAEWTTEELHLNQLNNKTRGTASDDTDEKSQRLWTSAADTSGGRESFIIIHPLGSMNVCMKPQKQSCALSNSHVFRAAAVADIKKENPR